MKRTQYDLVPDGTRVRSMRLKKGNPAPQTTTTTQSNIPWEAQQPYLKEVFGGAQARYQSDNPSYFGGPTVTPFNPAQLTAQGMGTNRAMSGNPLLPAAQGQAMQTLQGDYLNAGNPHTANLVRSITESVRPRSEE